MNLFEKIKEEKGIVNIDNFRCVIGELIDESIKHSIYKLDKKDNLVSLIENMIILRYRNDGMKNIDVEDIKNLSSAYCGKLIYSKEYEEKGYRDILIECIWNSLGKNVLCVSEDGWDIIQTSKTLSKIINILEYILSGNIPFSQFDNIPIEDLENGIKEIIEYFYGIDFED